MLHAQYIKCLHSHKPVAQKYNAVQTPHVSFCAFTLSVILQLTDRTMAPLVHFVCLSCGKLHNTSFESLACSRDKAAAAAAAA